MLLLSHLKTFLLPSISKSAMMRVIFPLHGYLDNKGLAKLLSSHQLLRCLRVCVCVCVCALVCHKETDVRRDYSALFRPASLALFFRPKWSHQRSQNSVPLLLLLASPPRFSARTRKDERDTHTFEFLLYPHAAATAAAPLSLTRKQMKEWEREERRKERKRLYFPPCMYNTRAIRRGEEKMKFTPCAQFETREDFFLYTAPVLRKNEEGYMHT